jgi:hypothetical protein
MVVHTCNPNYVGGRDGEGHGLRPAQAKMSVGPYLQKQTGCGDSVILAAWEAGAEDHGLKLAPGKVRPYLKNKVKQKGLLLWLEG